MKRTSLVAILAASLASLGSAQTLVGRTSNLNYAYVYGAGGNTLTGNDSVTDSTVLDTDDENLDFTGSTSGTLGTTPYTASVAGSVAHAYLLFGTTSAFTGLQVEQGSTASAASTGPAVAQFSSLAPGNELVLEFTLSASVSYHLFGFLSVDVQNAGANNFVALQKWDGTAWQNLYTTFSLGGSQGTIEQTGVMTGGLYRTRSLVGVNAFGNEDEGSTAFYQLEMAPVPEPMTLLFAAPALGMLLRARRRRA